MSTTNRTRVFICYSHRNRRFLDELHEHLAPALRAGIIELWDDTRLQGGEEWREEIKKALASAKVAICLVSASFRASKFIAEDELPTLLKAAKGDGLIVLPVVVGTCDFQESELAGFQAVNDPRRPLMRMRPDERAGVWVKVVSQVRRLLNNVSPAPGATAGAPTHPGTEATAGQSLHDGTALSSSTGLSGRGSRDRERRVTDILCQDKKVAPAPRNWSKYLSLDTEKTRQYLTKTQTLLRLNPLFVTTFGPTYYMNDGDDRNWAWWEFAVYDDHLWHSFRLDSDFYPSLESSNIAFGSVAATREAVAELVYQEFKQAVEDYITGKST